MGHLELHPGLPPGLQSLQQLGHLLLLSQVQYLGDGAEARQLALKQMFLYTMLVLQLVG